MVLVEFDHVLFFFLNQTNKYDNKINDGNRNLAQMILL